MRKKISEAGGNEDDKVTGKKVGKWPNKQWSLGFRKQERESEGRIHFALEKEVKTDELGYTD